MGEPTEGIRRYAKDLLAYQRSYVGDLLLIGPAIGIVREVLMRCGAQLLPEGSADIGGIGVLCGRAFRDERDADWLAWALLNPSESLADLDPWRRREHQ